MTTNPDQRMTDLFLEQAVPLSHASPIMGAVAVAAYLVGHRDTLFAANISVTPQAMHEGALLPRIIPDTGLSIERITDPEQVVTQTDVLFRQWQLDRRANQQRNSPDLGT